MKNNWSVRKKTENGYCCYACGTCKTAIYLVAMRINKNNLRSESGQIMSRLMRELFILCRCHFPRVGPSGANPLSLASSLGQSCTNHHFFQPQSSRLLFSFPKIPKKNPKISTHLPHHLANLAPTITFPSKALVTLLQPS